MKKHQEILLFAQKHAKDLRKWKGSTDYEQKKCFPMFSKMEKYQIAACYFLSITKMEEMCRLLKVNEDKLIYQINYPDYRTFSIEKKRGGKREISVPNETLKEMLRRLNNYLQAYYKWIRPACVYGFVTAPSYGEKYCNIAENARNHIDKKFVLNIDLKDFFSNISGKRVKELFDSEYFIFPKSIATAFSLLVIYQGRLPTGSPTSPVISNFICLGLDADLEDFCNKNGLTYSRYADDLSFSSDEPITEDITIDLMMIIHQNGFVVNPKKIHRKTNNQQQIVTGLVVNEKVNIRRALLKKIRAMLHDLTQNGVAVASENHFGHFAYHDMRYHYKFLNKLGGYIDFVGQIRGKDDGMYLIMKRDYEKFLVGLK